MKQVVVQSVDWNRSVSTAGDDWDENCRLIVAIKTQVNEEYNQERQSETSQKNQSGI